eukprot:15342228-Alexandrium_andersonii.AAC.1
MLERNEGAESNTTSATQTPQSRRVGSDFILGISKFLSEIDLTRPVTFHANWQVKKAAFIQQVAGATTDKANAIDCEGLLTLARPMLFELLPSE